MDNMRFNQGPNREPERHEDTRTPVRSKNKGILLTIFFIITVGVLVYGAWYMYQKKNTFVLYDAAASPYYAVFLTNGQVYFGRPLSKSRSEFVLSDVYYLQVSAGGDTPLSQQQSTEQRFALVKLGQEIHGPTDRLFINNQNVLFYEQLSKESKVVQSIAEKQ